MLYARPPVRPVRPSARLRMGPGQRGAHEDHAVEPHHALHMLFLDVCHICCYHALQIGCARGYFASDGCVGCILMHLDAFGCIGMHWDAF